MRYLGRHLAEKGIRAADLARELGVAPQLINNWKKRGVPARRFRDLATVLDVPIEDIEAAYGRRVLVKPIETVAQRRLKESFGNLAPDQQQAVLQVAEALLRAGKGGSASQRQR